ncbi:MAG: gamma-glutamylcyclotransferase, partial [Alphaproteobacteria bacterium]
MQQIQTKRPTTYFDELSDTERAASLQAMLACRPKADDIWVFAYGSLIWRPCFNYVTRSRAVLDGYRRRFSIWTLIARGTPAAPGLALALEAGDGACHGVAYCLTPGDRL